MIIWIWIWNKLGGQLFSLLTMSLMQQQKEKKSWSWIEMSYVHPQLCFYHIRKWHFDSPWCLICIVCQRSLRVSSPKRERTRLQLIQFNANCRVTRVCLCVYESITWIIFFNVCPSLGSQPNRINTLRHLQPIYSVFMEYTTRGVCGQEGCRETRYFLDNGLWFCRRGHQQEVSYTY